jgi:RNA-directed DNA polymerase
VACKVEEEEGVQRKQPSPAVSGNCSMRLGWKPKVNWREFSTLLAKFIKQADVKSEDAMGALLDRILSSENLRAAYHRVVTNKGAAGVDGMEVTSLKPYLQENWKQIEEQIRTGKYKPKAVRRVEIPKGGGGLRKLGIPTVLDRFIQQAIAQELMREYEPTFSAYSYGFRPGRSAHDAVKQAAAYINEGHGYVVEIDLEKFFDTVNHDYLMQRISSRIIDKEVLRLIRRYLQAGVMENGVSVKNEEGTPQGGPLSPLLANILLDELDKELEERGHKFVRYADDINIYVKTERAAERVKDTVSQYLEKKLKLRVNKEKTKVKTPTKAKILGLSFWKGETQWEIRIAPSSIEKLKTKLRQLTDRSWSISMSDRIKRINQLLRGWAGYFGIGKSKSAIDKIEEQLRTRLRIIKWKEWKRVRTRIAELIKLGTPTAKAYQYANTRKSYARVAHSPILKSSLTKEYFHSIGLIPLRQTLLLEQGQT